MNKMTPQKIRPKLSNRPPTLMPHPTTPIFPRLPLLSSGCARQALRRSLACAVPVAAAARCQVLADHNRQNLYIALTKNGGGHFSKERVNMLSIEACLTAHKALGPFPSKTLKDAYKSKSNNNSGLLLATTWSGAFTPTKTDKGLLSADRETVISPKAAYDRYLEQKKLEEGGGVWGVSIDEFRSIGLQCFPNPITGNEAHVLVDFASHGAEKQKTLGKLAYVKATTRGRLCP
jgi:hypothetical protein